MAFDTKTHAVVIKALGIEALPPKEQEMILERSGALIYQSVVTRAMEEMDEPALDEFEKHVSGDPTAESVLAFFHAHIPNFDAMIEEETKLFLERGE